MKRSFGNHGEVCHIWSTRSQYDGYSGNISFERDTLYSYGHYPIAHFSGKRTVCVQWNTYSLSTSQHISHAYSAIDQNRYTVFTVPRPVVTHHSGTPCYGAHYDNVRHYIGQVEKYLDRATRARTRDYYSSAIWNIVALEQYLIMHKIKTHIKRAMPAYRAFIRSLDWGAIIHNREAFNRSTRRALAEYKDNWDRYRNSMHWKNRDKAPVITGLIKTIQDFREHRYYFRGNYYRLPTLLRLSRDREQIETSRSANIPAQGARRVWKLVCAARTTGQDITTLPESLARAFYPYTFHKCDKQGNLTIGCHHIEYQELVYIAEQLGFIGLPVAINH